MPIRIKVNARLFIARLTVEAKVKCGFLTVFNEVIKLEGNRLNCSGTVDAKLKIVQIDRKNGIDLIKCLTFDKIFVSLQNNLSFVSSKTILAENAFTAIATNLACLFCNCQIASEVIACLDESKVCAHVAVSVNVAELSFCLLKQGVQLWMRKLAKLSKLQSRT